MTENRGQTDVSGLTSDFQELTLASLSDFVNKFNEIYTHTGTALPRPAPVVKGTEIHGPIFDLVLESWGEKKVSVIRVARSIDTTLGLKQAKDLVERAPVTLFWHLPIDDAVDAMNDLVAAGAQVRLRKITEGDTSLGQADAALKRHSARPPGFTREVVSSTEVDAVLADYIDLLGSQAAAAASLGLESNQMSSDHFVADHDRALRMGRIKVVGTEFTKYWNRSLFGDWLATPNGHLNFSTPLQMIEMEEIDPVLSSITADAYGVYS